MRRFVVLAAMTSLLIILFGTGFLCAKDKKPAEAEALFQRARELSDIRCEGCEAFRLRAHIRFTPPAQPAIEGTYLLIWRAPEKWAEHIRIKGHWQVRARDGETIWRQATTKYDPFPIHRITAMMNIRSHLQILPWEEVRKVETRSENGYKHSCITLRSKLGGIRRLSFHLDSGFMLRDENSNLAWGEAEFSDYRAEGGKFFPWLIVSRHQGMVLATAAVEERRGLTEQDLQLLVPPLGSTAEPVCSCPSMDPAKPLNLPPPVYPSNARMNGISGKVSMFAVIGEDGKPHNLTVLASPAPELSDAALAAVQQWHYEPSVCGGRPFPVPQTIEINFTLR